MLPGHQTSRGKAGGRGGFRIEKTTLPARKSSQRSTLNGRFQYYYILKTIDFADNYSEKVHNICAPGQLSKNVSNFCLLETLIHLIFEILELVQTLYTVNTFAMGYENVFTLFRKNTLSVNKKIKFLIPNTWRVFNFIVMHGLVFSLKLLIFFLMKSSRNVFNQGILWL